MTFPSRRLTCEGPHTQRSRGVDGLLPIRGCELGPSSAPVSGLSSCAMGSEVLGVCLPAGSVCGEFFQGNSTLFDHESRLVAVGDEHGLNDGLFLPSRGHGHKQVARRFARLNSAGTFPSAGEGRSERATET